MLINWFTVVAQVVNFLILVWLMRRYLYRPIVAAIDARAKQVAGVLAEADKKMTNASDQLSAYQQQVKGFDADRARRETEVDEALKAERLREMQAIQDDAKAARQAEATDLRRHQSEFAKQLGQLVESEVLAVTRKTMTDLADASLEHQLVGMFIRRLATLDATAHVGLSDALKHAPEGAVLSSSFALAEADRAALSNAVNLLAAANVTLSFTSNAKSICGIELSCAGQRAAWSVTDYLNGLSAKAQSLLEQNFAQDKAMAAKTANSAPLQPQPLATQHQVAAT
jgi:F-type H+-transporting ATPase subunit b